MHQSFPANIPQRLHRGGGLFEMNPPVAAPTERDEVFFAVITKSSSGLDVVNLQACRGATFLTTPSVTIQDRLTELFVRLAIQT
jgi:hypothetical protein